MNQPQVSIFPVEMTTALYRRAIASAWRQKMLNETGSDQYGPHSLTVGVLKWPLRCISSAY